MKLVKSKEYYDVIHEHLATDRYRCSSTTVKATSKQEAMDMVNQWIAEMPDHYANPLPCKSIDSVHALEILL